MGWRVPLHRGSHGVAVIGRDVVALAVDVKKDIHLVGERVLRGVHVGMAQSGVVRVRVLPIEHGGVVVADPPRLIRGYFHPLGPSCSRSHEAARAVVLQFKF